MTPRMKLTVLLIATLVVCSTFVTDTEAFGLGVIVGEPTGLSYKSFVTKKVAIDGALAWGFSNDEALQIHFDALVHGRSLGTANGGRFPIYYGLGVRVKFENVTNIALRAPLGIVLMFKTVPADLFMEAVPMLQIDPGNDISLDIAFGARYYF